MNMDELHYDRKNVEKIIIKMIHVCRLKMPVSHKVPKIKTLVFLI